MVFDSTAGVFGFSTKQKVISKSDSYDSGAITLITPERTSECLSALPTNVFLLFFCLVFKILFGLGDGAGL